MLSRNAKAMTERALISVMSQDIRDIHLFIVDNGSTDGTREWVSEIIGIDASFLVGNFGVSHGWNYGLTRLFCGADHVLVINNDVQLPTWFYRNLLSYEVPFVTGTSSDAIVNEEPPKSNLIPHPDFSAFLIRRSAWEAIGPFDEGMKHYASDCDYHIRAAHEGIPLLKANAPFYHERSSTIRLASPKDALMIQLQADADRGYFYKKWGFVVGSDEYNIATQLREAR